MTEIAPEIADIEASAAAVGVDMALVLNHSGVSVTTWWRWKSGRNTPRLATLHALRRSIGALSETEPKAA